MIFYIIIFIVLAFFAVEYEIGKKNLSIFYLILIVSLILFAGLRSSQIGRDYLLYQFAFDYIGEPSNLTGNDFLSVYEPGFIAVTLFFKWLFPFTYTIALMIFFAVAAVSLKAISFYKYSLNPFLALLVYYGYFFFIQEMTQIRVGLAAGIYLFSLQYYFKNKYISFVFLILLASLFHYSALLFLSTLIFKKDDFKSVWFIILLFLTLPLGIIKIPAFNIFNIISLVSESNVKLENYSYIIEQNLGESGNIWTVSNLINILVSAYLLIIVPKEDILKDKYLNLFLKLNITGIFIFSLFSSDALLSFRISELFSISSIFLIPYLVIYLPFKKFNVWFVVIIAFLLLFSNLFLGKLIEPYKFYDF